MPSRLTDEDRDVIARARVLAAAVTADSLRHIVGRDAGAPDSLVRTEGLGVAQHLLGKLADIAERVGNA